MTWLKYLGAALAAVALFVSGYKYAASIYKAEIANCAKNTLWQPRS